MICTDHNILDGTISIRSVREKGENLLDSSQIRDLLQPVRWTK
jgi:hypothetical protein